MIEGTERSGSRFDFAVRNPEEVETLWATPIEKNLYRLDNIPFLHMGFPGRFPDFVTHRTYSRNSSFAGSCFNDIRLPKRTFVVKYVYQIKGRETALLENPKIELELPYLVTVTTRPIKPSCSDCRNTVDLKNGNRQVAIPIRATDE
jgi:hypothetical protein